MIFEPQNKGESQIHVDKLFGYIINLSERNGEPRVLRALYTLS